METKEKDVKPIKEQILLGQNILLTLLTIAVFTLAYLLPFYRGNWFPGPAAAITMVMSFMLSAGAVATVDGFNLANMRFRFVANFCHLTAVLWLYTALRGRGLLTALAFIGGLICMDLALVFVPFPKDYGDPQTTRGLRTAICSTLFGTVGVAIVMIVTTVF